MDLMNTEQRNTGQSRFEQLVARLERVERPLEVSDRVAQVFLNNEYVFPVESGTPERALTRWLALVDSSWRSSRRNGPTSYPEELIDCRDGEVADEFVTTILERIRFWSKIRRDTLAIEVESAATLEIAKYLERLRWVYAVAADEEFRDLGGSHRLAIIAAAIESGSERALRVWHDRDLSDEEIQEVVWARNELIFLVEHDRGLAVEFKPERSSI
jgi:hypothetical protein